MVMKRGSPPGACVQPNGLRWPVTGSTANRAMLSLPRLDAKTWRPSGVTTMAVGMITAAAQANALVANGEADLVALARALLWDPRWPWHAAAQLGGAVSAPPQYWRAPPHGSSGSLQ